MDPIRHWRFPLRLRDLLEERFSIMVSLPRNEAALARAAEEAGADCMKVHLNVHHRASGTAFGSWSQERDAIREILAAVEIPVGVVPGAETLVTDDELTELAAAGIDFWDAFLHHAPTRLLGRADMECMLAVNYQFPLERAAELGAVGARVIEASIVPPEEYGSTLSARDLVNYRTLARHAAPTPIMIPSQRKLRPEDVPFLWAAGARGVVLGAIVTGHDAESLAACVSDFRRAVDGMLLEHGELDTGWPGDEDPTRRRRTARAPV